MVAPGFFELLVVVANAVLAFGALATLLAAVLLKLGGAASTSAVAVFVNLSAVTVATTLALPPQRLKRRGSAPVRAIRWVC